jgi:hypothetical protein
MLIFNPGSHPSLKANFNAFIGSRYATTPPSFCPTQGAVSEHQQMKQWKTCVRPFFA